MCDKALDNYPYALKSVPGCYMTPKTCDKVLNTYHSTIQFDPDIYKTQKMCDKPVNRCLLSFIYVTKLFLKILLS